MHFGTELAGIGIPSHDLDKVFEAFYTTKLNGTGMGLSVCLAIVTSHGGKLWAEINPLGGSIFQFTIPVFHANEDRMSHYGTYLAFHPLPSP